MTTGPSMLTAEDGTEFSIQSEAIADHDPIYRIVRHEPGKDAVVDGMTEDTTLLDRVQKQLAERVEAWNAGERPKAPAAKSRSKARAKS